MNFTEKENLLAYPKDTSCQFYDVNGSELEACLSLSSNNTIATCIQELKSEENLKYCTRLGFNGKTMSFKKLTFKLRVSTRVFTIFDRIFQIKCFSGRVFSPDSDYKSQSGQFDREG